MFNQYAIGAAIQTLIVFWFIWQNSKVTKKYDSLLEEHTDFKLEYQKLSKEHDNLIDKNDQTIVELGRAMLNLGNADLKKQNQLDADKLLSENTGLRADLDILSRRLKNTEIELAQHLLKNPNCPF